METHEIKHWQAMSLRDPEVMGAWLAAVGFREHATYRDEGDPAVVLHAEWVWEGGGGLMVGSERDGSGVTPPGRAAAYLVTDDPDALLERAVTAGATVERPVVDHDYGGRGGTVRDPEGNHWSFGSYQPG